MIESHKRIAKNTIILYIRMLLIMAVSLYTTRVVLQILGVEDFGVYNVVSSVVIMFVFLNSALTSATQRFLTFEIGSNNLTKLKKTFSTAFFAHILLAIIVLFLTETVGLWFLHNKINIPPERMQAATFVFNFSALAIALSIIRVPYNALIIAHEKMNVFAYISIIEALLKLAIVFLLAIVPYDKLAAYSFLTFFVTVVVLLIYIFYSLSKFQESKVTFVFDKNIVKNMLNFSGWSLIGSTAWILLDHGINIMLNLFFGPVVNAARGISFQVNSAILLFVTNFRVAVNPQIIKLYANNDDNAMKELALISSRYTYYLALILVLPILYETKDILNLWLGSVPEYTVRFTQLILIFSLIQTFDMSFGIVFQAIGRIKENQILSGTIYILVLPISYYIMTNYITNPAIVYYVQIVSAIFVSFAAKVYLLNRIADISYNKYFKRVIFPTLKVTIVVLFFISFLKFLKLYFILNILIICLLIPIIVFYLDMDSNMKSKIFSIVKNYVRKSK